MKKLIILLAVLGCGTLAAQAADAKAAPAAAPAAPAPAKAAAAPAAQPQGVTLPIMAGRGVPCSAVLARDYETTSKPQPWYNLKALIKSNRFDPNEDMSSTKKELRPPAAGKIYLILPFKFMDRKKLYQQGKVGLPRLPKRAAADLITADIPGGITDILLEMRDEERNG